VRTWLGLLLGLSVASACAFRGPSTPSAPSRLAYVGLDGQVYTVPLDGGDSRRVSVVPGEAPMHGGERLTRWPTWAPDGTRLAFMRFDVSRTAEDKALIFIVGADGSGLTKVFESTDEMPIYMAWAPDGSSLTVLTQRKTDLRLQLIDPSGARPPREIAQGGPLYFAWSPDARSLMLHVNGDHLTTERAMLALLRPDSSDEALHPLSTSPSDFRAPAWSADGRRMAFVAQVPGGQAALAVQDAGGSDSTRLAPVGREPAFLWSPSADRLAFSSRVSDQVPLYNGIETIKADGAERQRVTDANVAAFYWSPDGKRLAYAGLDPNARALAWFVTDPDGKNRRQVASFIPSDEQFFMFRFFDQYAQSHAVWSPDGKYLVYAGSAPEASRAGAQRDAAPGKSGEADDESAQIFIAATDGNSAPRALVDGSIGLWPVPLPRR
jgi:TolB protein